MKEKRSWMDNQSRAWLSSEKGLKRVLGALLFPKWRFFKWLFVVTLLLLVLLLLLQVNWQNITIQNITKHLEAFHSSDSYKYLIKGVELLFITLVTFLVYAVCDILTNIYTLRKNEKGITWCQIIILITIGLWIVGFILIFELQKDRVDSVLFGISGALLVWIFQEKVKGAVTFIHLRSNHLLNIDDWIKVPKYDVDGIVTHVTLTTVTIYNWDTTTSNVPMSALDADHFINLQNMLQGRTYGRRMFMSFVLDTSWFHPLSKKELDDLKKQIQLYDQKKNANENVQANELECSYFPEEEMKEGALNAHLYRLYLYHWLMRHDHISQQPRLIVRWMESKEGGIPLQVCAFIIDSNFTAFEWQQSLIIEHIMESMEWFGLRLYQSPSAYDVSNSNIYMADQPATYRKEEVK